MVDYELSGGCLSDLSPCELRTLELMAAGLSNTAIATQRVVSRRTVECNVNAILGKLCLRLDPHLDRRVAAVLVYRSARANGELTASADELGSTLAGAALAIEAARKRMARDPGGADDLLAQASVQVSSAVDEVRGAMDGGGHGLRRRLAA
jgi:hypothetical protein